MNKRFLVLWIWVFVIIGLLVPGGFLYHHYRVDITQAYQRVSSNGKMVQTPCGPIQYTEFGSGAPMLMIHGAGGGYDQGAYFAQKIGENFHWIVPSRFGYLGTPAPQNASSELQADAHACLLDALGIDKVGVVGVSGGGPSALLFAARYPQRTTALVMVDAVSHAMPARPAYLSTLFNVFTNDFVFWALLHTSKDGLLSALGVPAEDQKALSPETLAETYGFLETILPMSQRQAGQALEQHMSEYDTTQIKNIEAPTLVIHARNDTLVAFEQGEFTVKTIPGAQLVALDHGGHLALLFSTEMRAEVVDFLAQHNP